MATDYYVEKVGPDRFDLRQTRYRSQRLTRNGNGHPHDAMAAGFTAEAMREVIARHFSTASIDTSALDRTA